MLGLFAVAGHVFDYLMSAVFGGRSVATPVAIGRSPSPEWAFFYARTRSRRRSHLGMAIVGLRAVNRDGSDLTGGQAIVRVLVTPLSFLVFFLGFWLILIRGDRRALHDLIARTAVVYGWDARAAHLRFLAKKPLHAAGHAVEPVASQSS